MFSLIHHSLLPAPCSIFAFEARIEENIEQGTRNHESRVSIQGVFALINKSSNITTPSTKYF